jgi:hypothetical protein
MSLLAALVLSIVCVLFLMLVVTLARLIWEDSKAVEIDLHEIEGWD